MVSMCVRDLTLEYRIRNGLATLFSFAGLTYVASFHIGCAFTLEKWTRMEQTRDCGAFQYK